MNRFREKLFLILQPAGAGNLASRVFDLFITLLVLLSVVSVFAVTFDLSATWSERLQELETFVSIVFTVEYLLRLFTSDLLYPGVPKWRAPFRYAISGMAVIDLLAILPFYLPMVFSCNLLAIRIFRLVRLLRIFKLNRYFESLSAIGEVVRSKSRELIGSMFFVALMLVIASLVIYAAEHDAQPDAFKNAFSGLWWAVATLTTVGYGDIYPITVLGRTFGAIIALLGIGMVAIPTGIISSGLVEQLNSRKSRKDDASHGANISYCPYCGRKLAVGDGGHFGNANEEHT